MCPTYAPRRRVMPTCGESAPETWSRAPLAHAVGALDESMLSGRCVSSAARRQFLQGGEKGVARGPRVPDGHDGSVDGRGALMNIGEHLLAAAERHSDAE